jgi:hypothetical protein
MSGGRVRCSYLFAFLSVTVFPSLAAAQDFRTMGEEFYRNDDPRPSTPPPPAPPRPPDPPAPPFGARGEWVVGGDSSIGLSWTTYDASDARFFSAAFVPGLDWFVAQNVSVGVGLGGSYSFSEGYGADGSLVATYKTTLSVAPRFGYNLPLGASFSLYPRAIVGFEWVHTDESLVQGASLSTTGSPLGYPSTTQLGPWLAVYVPLVWHLASHAFVGLGPTLSHDFAPVQGGPNVGGEVTHVGASVVVGGWWGGPAVIEAAVPPADAGAVDAAPIPPRRFGEKGEFVLTSDFGASVGFTTYAGSPSQSTTASIAPGVDYFVVPHVAVGAAMGFSYSNASGLDPMGAPPGTPTSVLTVTNTHKTFSVAPRLAVEAPLGRWVSLYIRGGFAFGGGSYEEVSASSRNAYSYSYISVDLFAPLLVHPAQHFFVGFGPSLGHDLVQTINESGASNQSTTIGAGFIVGAWL